MIRMTVGAIALAMSMSAMAQESRWYAGGSLGQSNVDIDTAAVSNNINSLGLGHSGVSADETDVGWKAFVGHKFNRFIAIEGGAVSLGEFSARANVVSFLGGAASGVVNVTAETDPGLFATALGIAPIGDGARLFAKVGFYSIKTKGTATLTGPGGSISASSSDTTTDLLFGAGFEYDLSRTVALRAEWERFSDVGDENSTGKGDIDLMSIGVVFRF